MKKLVKVLFLLLSVFLIINSCKKESDNSSSTTSVTGGGNSTATISGRAIDESNNAVSGASVTINGQTATTDSYGIWLLKDISVSSRCIATITKTGYFKITHAFAVSAGKVNYLRDVLISNAQTNTISSSSGGTASLTDGSSIQFAANSFVDATSGSAYSGTVNLSIKHLSPDATNFGFMIPGNDLLGKNSSGNDVALYTYGMVGAELTGSSGQQLQLATGTTATITMPIAASQLAAAPTSIPLWYFDEATSLWMEQGSATKVGSNYVGTVSHFTWWNCDYAGPVATIIGKVLDCNSVPMPNIVVTIAGIGTLVTNSQGLYTNWVPAGIPLTVQVLASNNFNIVLNSQMENVPALSPNQTYYVPDLIVPCPARMSGNLQKCTGESVDGTVLIDWSGGTAFEYASNGSFNLAVPASSTVNIEASSYYNSNWNIYQGQFNSGALGITTDVGAIQLCSQGHAANEVTINGGGFVNQYFVMPTAYATVSGTTVYINYPNFDYSGYHFSTFAINIGSTSIGTTQLSSGGLNAFYMSFNQGATYYNINSHALSTSSGPITLFTAGSTPGSHFIGSYACTVGLLDNDTIPVTINGYFDAIR